MFAEKLVTMVNYHFFFYFKGNCINLCMSVKNSGKEKKLLPTFCPFQQPQLLKNNKKMHNFTAQYPSQWVWVRFKWVWEVWFRSHAWRRTEIHFSPPTLLRSGTKSHPTRFQSKYRESESPGRACSKKGSSL